MKRTCAICPDTSARRCEFVFAERIEDVLAAAIPELTAGLSDRCSLAPQASGFELIFIRWDDDDVYL